MARLVSTIITLLVVGWSGQGSAVPVALDGTHATYDLSGKLSYLPDPQSIMTMAVVEPSTFLPLARERQQFGYQAGAVWFKVDVRNATDSLQQLLLQIKDTTTHDAVAYVRWQDGRLDTIHTGGAYGPTERALGVRHPVFPIDFAPAATASIYVRIMTYNFLNADFALADRQAFLVEDHLNQWVLGFYYGIVLALSFYNLFLYFTTRDVSHVLYVAFVLATGTTLFIIDGLADLVAHDLGGGGWQRHASTTGNLALIGALFFTRSFLSTKTWQPVLDKIMLVIVACCVLVLVYENVDPEHVISARLTDINIFAASLSVVTAGAVAVIQGFRPARFYMFSWIVLILMTFVWLAMTYGLVPRNLITVHGIHFGSALEMIFMSLGLGDRLRRANQERQDAERRVRESSAIAQSAQMLAHDTRRPFRMLDATLQQLQKSKDSSDALALLGENLPSIRTAMTMADGLFQDMMMLGAPRRAMLAEHSLTHVLRPTLSSIIARQTAATVTWNVAMTHQRMMVADGDKLQRVLLNILENACQAIGGRGRVWIKSRDVKLNQHAYVEICLGNDGPLIAPGELPHVFEAFYTKGKRQGTGLGLAIARKAIEDQNGKITCRSKLDTGTEFVLHIPAAEAIDVNAGRAFDLPQVAAPIASTSSVVALIEDDPFLLDAWVKTMTDATLVTFASPDEWAAAVATKPAWLERLAVVVTDLCFSSDVEAGTDAGLELIRALKADRPQVPVLISSELAATLELNGVPSIAKRAHRYKELQTYLPSDSSSLPVAPAPKFS